MTQWTEDYQYERYMRMRERMDGEREFHVRDMAKEAQRSGNSRIRFPIRTSRNYVPRWLGENDTLPPPRNSFATIEVVAIQPLFNDDNGLIVIEHLIRHAYDEAVQR